MFAHGRIETLISRMKRVRRRGTILLLVLGALAMVLILTVVYAALGKGDRTTGRAANANRDANAVVGRFADQVVGVLRDDVFDAVPDLAEERLLAEIEPGFSVGELAGVARYLTERTDKPVSDFSMLSVPSLSGATSANAAQLSLRQFRPSGGHSTLTVWPEDDVFARTYLIDPRHAADPFLASTRPTDLGFGSKSDQLLGGSYDNAPFFARALDWHQISNVAPDGRFVNLAFLRGNFDVPSLDLTRNPQQEDESRLSLFDEDGRAVVEGDAGFVLGFADVQDYASQEIDDNGSADPDWNVPAHWTMYQRNMARTVAELSRNGFDSNDPSDPRYWEYSYADADGDGIIDSRWFELVDASSGFEVPLLGDSDRRYFAAVRVIDLSSLVNVNTASDTIAAPTVDNRAGQGPHDVNLFTLLNLDMHRAVVTGRGGADIDGFGGDEDEATYESFFSALNDTDERNDYDQLDADELARLGRKSYLRLRQSLLDWEVYPVFDEDVRLSGVPLEANADAVWSSDLTNYSPYAVNADGAGEDEGPLDLRRQDFALIGSSIPGFAGGGNARTGPFGVSDLVELLTFHGANDPDVFSSLERAFLAYNGYDGGEASELRTRSLLRSDRSLDAEIGVELSDDTGTLGSTLSAEELNRRARAQLDVRSLLTTISGSRPLRAVTTTGGGLFSLDDGQRRFRVDELMLGSPVYEGQGLTGDDIAEAQRAARDPLVENGFEVYLRTLAPFLGEFEGGTAWPIVGVNGTIGGSLDERLSTLFYGHTGPEMAIRMAAHMAVNFRDAADAPFVDLNNDGVPDPGALVGVEDDGGDAVITIDTNGDGVADGGGTSTRPEYGERRDEPTAALVWLVGEDERNAGDIDDLAGLLQRPSVNGAIGGTPDLEDVVPVLDADVVFGKDDPADSVLAAEPNRDRSADAMIVYGVEAQPFLSEVFYFNAYWDAPRRPVTEGSPTVPWETQFLAGETSEDSDYLRDNRRTGEYLTGLNLDPGDLTGSGGAARDEAVRGVSNIDGHVSPDNRDFLFQVAVFQVFNPFDVPVSLRDFYIEFGGSVYVPEAPRDAATRLADLMIQPGETRLLYAANPTTNFGSAVADREDPIADRIDGLIDTAFAQNAGAFNNVRPTFGGTLPDPLVQTSFNNLIPDSTTAGRIPLRRFDSAGQNEITDTDLLWIDDPTDQDSDYGQPDARNKTVLLWRDLGVKQTSGGANWRRDDLLADRLVDPGAPSDPPVLDQRLELPTTDTIAATSLIPDSETEDFRVNDAFTLDGTTNIDDPSVVAYKEETIQPPQVNMNVRSQRTVGLWGRIRRFDTTADATGAGGRRANDLPGPNGVVSLGSQEVPTGAFPTIADGDAGVLGLPTGALPAAALATSENVVATTSSANGVGFYEPDQLHFRDSFPDLTNIIGNQSFETATTIEEFFTTRLTNISDPGVQPEFRENRQQSFESGVMDSIARYSFDPQPDPMADTPLYGEYNSVSGIDPDGDGPMPSQGGVSTRTAPYAGRDLIQVSQNSREFRSEITGFPQLRVGDLLNVLAVGPYRMPLRTPPAERGPDGYGGASADSGARLQAYTDQWTTLSEVLGVAENTLLGSDLEPPMSANSDRFAQLAGVLDRGHLRLDAFVPYFDSDADGNFDLPDDLDGDGDAEIDRVRGLGIPLALNIFDVTQAGGELPGRAYGGIDRAIAGMVNINTAPPSVLRLLPGLYQDVPVDADETEWPAWAGRTRDLAESSNLSVAFSNAFLRGSADPSSASGGAAELYAPLDIASSLLSYREPSSGYSRVLRAGGLVSNTAPEASRPLNMGPLAVIDDSGNSDLTRGVEMVRDFSDADLNGDNLFDVSGPNIEGLRTTPGFGSIGELLAVRPGGDVGMGENALRFQFGMDWLARDRRTVSQLFIDPDTGEPANGEPDFTLPDQVRNFVFDDGNQILSLDPSLLGDPLRFSEDAGAQFRLPVADQIPDDYDEQLIQMNLLTNSVSTSSDFYAAWMVVHGFADDDVEGLEPNEPMRPSFAARYLMIVDRSNVVNRADRPRVLAFLEVPYGEEVRNAVYTPE
ncbi:MAG: hypothetical protein AAF937_05020 [Planctomycetota bacterium]